MFSVHLFYDVLHYFCIINSKSDCALTIRPYHTTLSCVKTGIQRISRSRRTVLLEQRPVSNYRSECDGGWSTSDTYITADPMTSTAYDMMVTRNFCKASSKKKYKKRKRHSCMILIHKVLHKLGPPSNTVQHTYIISQVFT